MTDSPDSDDIGKFDPGLSQRMIGVMWRRSVLDEFQRGSTGEVLRNGLKSGVSG